MNTDNFRLQKKDLLMLLEAIEKRWLQNKVANWKYLAALKTMRIGIMLTGDKVIEKVWSDLILCVNSMLELNDLTDLSQDKGYEKGKKNIAFMRDNLIKKIQNGELF